MAELTPLQQFVTTLALQGLSGAEICAKANLARSTVVNVLCAAYKRQPKLKREVRLARGRKYVRARMHFVESRNDPRRADDVLVTATA